MEDNSLPLSTELDKDEKECLSSEQKGSYKPQTDRGWAWLVLGGSCVCNALFSGLMSAFGVLYVDIRKHLGITVAEVSVIGSLRNAFVYGLIIFASPLCEYLGCRRMTLIGGIVVSVSLLVCYFWISLYVYYIFLGALPGLGSALIYASSVIAVNDYFHKKRPFGLAMAIASCSVGGAVFPPITSFLLERFGLRGTILINVGFSLHFIVAGMLYFPFYGKSDKEDTEDTTCCSIFNIYKDRMIWRDRNFYFFIISGFLHGLSVYIPLSLLPIYVTSKNIPVTTASLCQTTLWVTTTVARVLAGIVAIKYPRSSLALYICAAVVACSFLFIVPVFRSVEFFFIVSAGYGMCNGYQSSLVSILLVEFFTSEKFPATLALYTTAYGVGSMMGAPIISSAAEAISIDGMEYVLAGVVHLMSGIIMVQTMCRYYYKYSRCNRQNHRNSTLYRQP